MVRLELYVIYIYLFIITYIYILAGEGAKMHKLCFKHWSTLCGIYVSKCSYLFAKVRSDVS